MGVSMVTACDNGSPDSQVTPPLVNRAPTASAVRIVDANGGEANVGDVLSGDYRYADADGDAEGASTFRWLRDGALIAGATNQAYTLTAADIGHSIAFEVTPVAQTGVRQGPAVQSLPITPLVNRAPTVSDVVPGFVDLDQAMEELYNDSGGVALGDGDGDLDAVVANDNQANRVYTNSLSGTWGDATFMDSAQALGTGSSTGVALGDVDGDGDLDAVVVNDNQANRVYTNDGSGTFSDSAQALGTGNSQAVALGDVDGDGDLDAVVVNNNQANRVYINDGSGTFSDSAQALDTDNSRDVALGDVDGDGDLDAVVVNFN